MSMSDGQPADGTGEEKERDDENEEEEIELIIAPKRKCVERISGLTVPNQRHKTAS